MKVAILSHVQLWPVHHAETIELGLHHKSLGDDVVILSCMGVLKGCPSNPKKLHHLCEKCNKQTVYTERNLLNTGFEHIKILFGDEVYSLPEIHSIAELNQFSLFDVPFGSLALSTIVSEIHDGLLDVSLHKVRIEELLLNSISLYLYAKKIFSDKKVDLCYVWNGRRSCDGPVTYAAKHAGVDYRTFISGGCYNTIDIRPTHYIHDLPYSKSILIKLAESALEENKFDFYRSSIGYFDFAQGNQRSSVNHVGFYQFSKEFSGLVDVDNKSKKKNVAIFVGTFEEFIGMPGYTSENDLYDNFYDGIRDILGKRKICNKFNMYVRWHPNSRSLRGNENAELHELIDSTSSIATHIPPNSNLSSYSLLKEADIVICFGTSMTIEACIYGKPVIFIGHNVFEDLDCFYHPSTRSELYELLQQDIRPKSFVDALKFGYYMANFGIYEYQHLSQVRQGVFYLNGVNIAAISLVQKIKNLVKLVARSVATKVLQRVGTLI